MAYQKCSHCGENAVHLATATGFELYGDQDDDDGNPSKWSDDYVVVENLCVGAHVCFECGELADVFIEEPRKLVAPMQNEFLLKELAELLDDTFLYITDKDELEKAEDLLKRCLEANIIG